MDHWTRRQQLLMLLPYVAGCTSTHITGVRGRGWGYEAVATRYGRYEVRHAFGLVWGRGRNGLVGEASHSEVGFIWLPPNSSQWEGRVV